MSCQGKNGAFLFRSPLLSLQPCIWKLYHTPMPSNSPSRLAMNCCRAVRHECQGQQHTSGGVRCQVRPENSAPAKVLLAHCPALPASSLHITPSVLVTETVANKPAAPAPPWAHVKCRALCDPELPTLSQLQVLGSLRGVSGSLGRTGSRRCCTKVTTNCTGGGGGTFYFLPHLPPVSHSLYLVGDVA